MPIAYRNSFTFYQRSRSFLRYIFQATRLARSMKDVQLCYAMSVPLTIGIAGWRIKQRLKIPFVFEVGDLWPDAPIELGYIKNFFFRKSLYALEKKIYNAADAIVALSPTIKDAIEKKVNGKIVHVIPNMADTDFFRLSRKDSAMTTTYSLEGKFVISYSGAFGFANGLDYLIRCAEECQYASLPMHFLLCGDGAMREHLVSEIRNRKLQNITIVPFTNREGVRDVLRASDAAFISYLPFKILETGSPNKYFDALAAGKLIVNNFSGWIKDEIEAEQCGFSCDPHAPTDFVNKIRIFLDDRLTLMAHQQAARALAEKKYSRRTLGEKFVKAIHTSLHRS